MPLRMKKKGKTLQTENDTEYCKLLGSNEN
jgi:hypothetical protein